MNKKNFKIICIILIIVLVTGCGFYYKAKNVKIHPLKASSGRVTVSVVYGDTLSSVVKKMGNNNLLQNAFITKYFINNIKFNSEVKPGNYTFSSPITLNRLVSDLNNGIFDEIPIKVTIPEGYSIEQIAVLLDSKGIINKAEFLKSCKDYMLPSYIKVEAKRKYALEGFLFPSTYEFLRDSQGKLVIDKMVKQFELELKEIEKKNNVVIKNEDIDKIVTMASIVEKEIETPAERGMAASVFYNRLKINMKLQSCATVLYAMGIHKDKLSDKDLQYNSPYNTYIASGLPVGPISNPGRDCLLAAIKPSNTNYLYFVSNNNGTHFFTNDFSKFSNVKKITQGN